MHQTPGADGPDAAHDAGGGEPPRTRSDAAPPRGAAPPVEIDVARTGGFAGLTRHWTVQPPEAEASHWITLVERCPWGDVTTSSADQAAGRRAIADGFVWRIRVSWSESRTREAELPEDALTEAWRDLVDAVRAWSRAQRDERPRPE